VSSNRLLRITTTLVTLAVGVLIGAHVSWALTAIVCVALALALAFSVALVRMEEDRDQWRAAANLLNLQPWQAVFIDRMLDPEFPGRAWINTPKQNGGDPAWVEDVLRHDVRRPVDWTIHSIPSDNPKTED
jgi:hypothetical protein